MATAKEDVQALLETLPDDASYDDIQSHLYVIEKVRRGEAREAEEGTFTQEEAKNRSNAGALR